MKKFYAVYEKNLRNVRKKSMQCRKKIYTSKRRLESDLDERSFMYLEIFNNYRNIY